ncbi:uncharacterized protein VNE69_09085 [Vairimorpha necatrix]|uniref:Uncharacterized protein n=1 Tax=Vairimorpha necatrix TaxID=6039 RepID=A0AAX4JET5_9MICR
MNIVLLINVILFVQTSPHEVFDIINNMILNKIINRDYTILQNSSHFTKVSLFFNTRNKTILFYTEENLINIDNNNTYISIIHYDNKSISDIIESIELNVRSFYKCLDNYSIVLTYSALNFGVCLTMKEVIKNITIINNERRIKKKGWDIYYENICENDSYLNRILYELKPNTSNNDNNFGVFSVHTHYKAEKDEFCIRLNIPFVDVYHLFELNIGELDVDKFYSLSDTNIKLNNKFDEEILRKLLCLFKISYNVLFKAFYIQFELECTSNIIEIMYPYFKAELKPKKIIFKHSSGEYVYHSDSKKCLCDKQNDLNEKYLLEFQKIMENISSIKNVENCRGVEMFYRLLLKNNKIDYLLRRILTKGRSPINLLCVHLLLSAKVITTSDANIIFNIEEDVENEIEEIINKSINGLFKCSSINDRLEFYTIKICLLIETERFIKESDVSNDHIFQNIKEIGILVKLKNSLTEDISFAMIIQEFISRHIDNIIKYNNQIMRELCNIAGLFRENSDLIIKDFKKQYNREEFIEARGLDKNKLKDKFGNIKLKLLRNNEEDKYFRGKRQETEFETKKLVKILQNTNLKERLNEILEEALNVDIENLLDEEKRLNFENKLITEGIKEIEIFIDRYVIKKARNIFEVIFYNYIFSMFRTIINEELINDFRIELEKSFKFDVAIKVKKVLEDKASKDLPKIIAQYFIYAMENNVSKRENFKKSLRIIQTILSKRDILEMYNGKDGIIINEDLIKVLIKNY